MADVDYKPDHRGTAQLMQSAAMHVTMIDVAFDAIPYATSISPDAPPLTEGYIDSFEVDGGHTERIAGTRRATAYLYNTSGHAAAVEWGWGPGNQPGHHVLAKTADHIEGII